MNEETPQAHVTAQDDVFAFLADPATHGGVPVKRIDTHAAAVFLAGGRAFKVKRAVRFPFLDYSTLARRQAACVAEIEANRPFAADLYRGAIAITRAPGGRLALGGTGEPVEWAVEMRRFDETRTLDRMADRGEIDLALADALARTVAAAHARAPVVEAAPWVEALGVFIAQNEDAFAASPALFPPGGAAALTAASRAALRKNRPLLLARGGLGLVRRGHGDLHLGNIALINGAPVPFDAIEFDPLVAAGDELYDLAFLLMDLIERNLTPAANVVLNRYLAETRRLADLDALAALPLFLSLRAAIRAKVTAARPAEGSDRSAVVKAATDYFQLACRLIAPPAPVLVAVGGLSGSGKSILARLLAPFLEPLPGAVLLRSDVKRKAMFGVAETDRLPLDAYRTEITDRIYADLVAEAPRPVAAGHSVIIDAVFARPEQRQAIEDAARAIGAQFIGMFLTADLESRVERVVLRSREASDASDAGEAIARRQEHYELGRVEWTRIDASGSPEETLVRARELLTRANE